MKVKPNITKKERDCLLAIYREELSDTPVRLVDLARSLNVKPPTALELLARLESKGYVTRRRGLIFLSESGREVAKGILTVHRALEVFFARCGLGADEACNLVSNFDYMVESSIAPMMLGALGNPSTCPHGYPIKTEEA